MADDYSPLYQTDTLVPLSCQFNTTSGTAVNLTNATITLVLSSANQRKTGTGTWTISNASAGQAYYDWSAADVATPGTWTLQIEIAVGGQSQHFDPKPLVIVPPI